MTRRTKIVATIGPATDEPVALDRVLHAGVDVVRLNLSHGPIEGHLERLAQVREAAVRAGRPVAVLADLPGPKIRAGKFADEGVYLEAGNEIELRVGTRPSDASLIHIDYPNLLDDLEFGDRVIIGDGAITVRITSIAGDRATALIETGSRTQGRPGVHIPSERTHLATPTPADLVLAEAVAAAGVEFVAVSFVRNGADVEAVREVVGDRAELVAKIETSAAIDNLEEFLEAADAIMVARGDLGIDCPLEDVPHLQKAIVRRCVEYGLPVITATQMLESMITAPSPTRAEVSDVANAVFDGTDALMLSGETAIGHDPAGTVATMASIAERAEREGSYRQWAARLGRIQRGRWDSASDRVTAALCHAASEAAVDTGARAILCCTSSGRTAKAMARFRPEADLIALSPNASTVNKLALSWGVDPIAVDTYTSTDEMVWYAVERAVQEDRVEPGDTVVVLVHGSLDRSAGLLKLSRRLDGRFRVTRYDRRGYGRSRPHPGPFGMDEQVADLATVLAGVAPGAGPAVVVGHSYGGNVALAAADRHPDLVAGVVTYETPLSWEPWWPSGSAGGDAMAWRDDPEEAAERFMRRLIGDARWARLPGATRDARRAEGPAMIGELSDLRAGPPWAAERVRVPVLALHGELGHEHHRIGTEALAERLPDARACSVPGARHFGPNTHPDEVAELVVDFVASISARSR